MAVTLSRSGGAAPVRTVSHVESYDGTAHLQIDLEDMDDGPLTVNVAGVTQSVDLINGQATADFTGLPGGIWDVTITPAVGSPLVFTAMVLVEGAWRAWWIGGSKVPQQWL